VSRDSGRRQWQMTVTVSVAASVTVSVSEGRVRGSDRGIESAARPRHGQAESTISRYCRLSRRRREPSQPRRHQDTKKTTKDSLREHLGALVVQPRAGEPRPPAGYSIRDDAACCGRELWLSTAAATVTATATATETATATAPEAVDPVDLHRLILSGWVGGNPKFEIRNPKWAGGRHSEFRIRDVAFPRLSG
jgi:hypothetical protein